MKKNIWLILFILLIPYLSCLLASLLSSSIDIGQGGNDIGSHLLGKEIFIEINGLYKGIDVEEYILGVLPGTISADYDMEALKVQAVLIRTNVIKEMEEKGTSDSADLSYEYLTVEEQIKMFGERNYERYQKRFEAAVVDTAGLVLRQEGNLIMALYHEVSIGTTASAQEVLGEEISYLQAADSSRDVEAKHYMNIVNYTWEELQKELQVESKEEKVEVVIEESTENGYVRKVSVDGTSYTGEEFMEKMNLSSINFYVEEIEGGLRFVCLGTGSGLGVSQYGANWMAQNGTKMEEIIKHYYTNVTLEKYR